MDERMISAQELAERWGVSASSIRHLVRRREDKLRAYKIGGRICIKISDAEAYLAAHEVKAPERPVAFPGMKRFAYKPGMKVVSL